MRARSHAERLASRDGYFAPDSVIRRIGNTPVTPLLGGGPAVLLQVAHPLVAAGVAAHSRYDDDLFRRFAGTLRALYFVVYGDRREAERAGAAVDAVHGRVHGTTETALGPFRAGTRYSARDTQLQLWVHATLVATSLAAYQRFVARLSADEQERYYREMSVVAQLFGVPRNALPPTLADFRAYFRERIASPEITVTPPARAVARVILAAPLPLPLRLLAPAHRLSTAALLPPRLRREYGLAWTRSQALALPLAARSLRLAAAPALLAAERVAV